MAQAGKTFRVFVSSPFSDLKAERNALQKNVFPRLRELCMRHGCRFQAIDLRWGVSEEAALDQQTMKICLKEIARCQEVTPRPNFIVLLGDRYGWRPLPAEIPADEFKAIKLQVTSETDLTLLGRFYLLDENALYRRQPEDAPVGLYCLRPRKVSEGDAATDVEREAAREAEAAEWRQVESQLQRILLDAVASLHLRDGELAKYYASATEQEIMPGAMDAPDAEHHVSCFFRKLRSANDQPLREDLPHDDAVKDFIDLNEDGSRDRESSDKLQDLQARLRERLGKNVHEYNAQWLGESESPITLEHIGALPQDLDECLKLVANEKAPSLLCVDVWRRLARVILAEIGQIESVPPVEREKEEHEKFGAKRAKHFRGRARYLEAINQYVNAGDQRPFALWGESGSGKSALLARAAEQIHQANTSAEMVTRFIGATPQSSDVRALLESLCQQISGLYGAEQETIPSDYNGLIKEFPNRLALATAQKPLVLILDALDQLSDAEHGRNLAWLPTKLPENVRLVVSTIPGDCLDALQRKLPPESILCLEAMPKSEGTEVLDVWLQDAGRMLQDDQRTEVLNKFAVKGLPLYLKLAFEETRLWHSYDGVSSLAADVPGIISNLFERLSHEANHGALMVSRSLGYLAAARNGLTEDEILAVLSSDNEVMSEFKRRSPKSPTADALPVVVWSRLYFDLEPYLTERSADRASLLAFYHRQLGEVVTGEFLAGEAKRERHIALGRFFAGQDYFLETLEAQRERARRLPPTARPANLRKASELAWQLLHAEQWEELEELLTNLFFLELKVEAGMVFDLASDFSVSMKAIPVERPQRRILLLLEEAIRRDVHFIARHPTTLFQCFWNTCWWYDDHDYRQEERGTIQQAPKALHGLLESWRLAKEEQTPGHRWVRSLWGPEDPLGTSLKAVFRFESPVQSIAVFPDGERIALAVSSLRLFEVQTGKEVTPPFLAERSCSRVAISPGGELLLSTGGISSDGKMLQLWDIVTSRWIARLAGHTNVVTCVAFARDGSLIVSGSADGTVRIWDVHRARQKIKLCPSTPHSLREEWKRLIWKVRRIRAPERRINSVALDPQGKQVACARGGMIQVWNLQTGHERPRIQGHEDYVNCIAFSPDGKRLISGSGSLNAFDCSVRVWDVKSGAELQRIGGHTGPVNCVAYSLDGSLLFSAGGSHLNPDFTTRVWDAKSGAEIVGMEGHDDLILDLAVFPDGRHIATASRDGTARIWEVLKQAGGRAPREHTVKVRDGRFSAEGHWVAQWPFEDLNSAAVFDARSGHIHSVLRGHTDTLLGLEFFDRDRRIVTYSRDLTVRVWDAETGQELCCLKGHTEPVSGLAIGPDTKRIASSSWDSTVVVWDWERARYLHCLRGHTLGVRCVCFSWDGQQIASGGTDKAIRIWNSQTGDETYCLRAERDIESIAFFPGGNLIAVGESHGRVSVRDLGSGRILRTADQASGNRLAVSADGNRVITGLYKGQTYDPGWREVRNPMVIWDLLTGNCERIPGRADLVVTVAAGFPLPRLRPESSRTETIIRDAVSGNTVVVFHASFVDYLSHPTSNVWAGFKHGRMHLFMLEGATVKSGGQ